MPTYLRALMNAPESAEPGTPVRFVASTAGIKRDGLDLEQSRWFLDNYRSNPVVLWGHDLWGHKPPIGRAEVSEEGDQLVADVVFDVADPFAAQIERKYRSGFLNAVSVSWDTVEMDGQVRYDLLEISAVPVPADPQALIQRQTAGLRALQADLTAILDDEAEPEIDPDPAEPEADPKARASTVEDAEGGFPLDEGRATEIDYAVLAAHLYPLVIRNLTYADSGQPLTPDDMPPARAGSVLSKLNTSDLTEAVRLINGVLERAQKVDPAADEAADKNAEREAAGDKRAVPDELLIQLQESLASFDA